MEINIRPEPEALIYIAHNSWLMVGIPRHRDLMPGIAYHYDLTYDYTTMWQRLVIQSWQGKGSIVTRGLYRILENLQ